MTTNQINWHALGETIRSNKAREQETHRANIAQEELTAQHNEEEIRSNMAREKETHRANRAAEKEHKRSNKAAEKENKRWHKSTVREQSKARKETTRANKAREAIELANTGITEKKVMLEASARNESNRIQELRNLREYTTKQVENQLRKGQLDATLKSLDHQIRNDNAKLKLEKRQQNLVAITSTMQTIAKYITDKAKQETVDKKTQTEIDKMNAEMKKLSLDYDIRKSTMTQEKMNKTLSVVDNARRVVGGILRDGLLFGVKFIK